MNIFKKLYWKLCGRKEQVIAELEEERKLFRGYSRIILLEMLAIAKENKQVDYNKLVKNALREIEELEPLNDRWVELRIRRIQ